MVFLSRKCNVLLIFKTAARSKENLVENMWLENIHLFNVSDKQDFIYVCVCVCIYIYIRTGLFEIIVGVLTTFHTQYTWDSGISIFYFFLWGYVKDQVSVPPLPASIPELKVRIRTAIETITADMLQTVWNKLDYRADVCRITKGAHIEHLYGM